MTRGGFCKSILAINKITSMKTQERIELLSELTKDNFVGEAIKLLIESKEDPSVTNEDHKQLFMVFVDKVDEFFSTPGTEKSVFLKSLKRITWLRFSEKKKTKLI